MPHIVEATHSQSASWRRANAGCSRHLGVERLGGVLTNYPGPIDKRAYKIQDDCMYVILDREPTSRAWTGRGVSQQALGRGLIKCSEGEVGSRGGHCQTKRIALRSTESWGQVQDAIISEPQWILFLHVTLNKLPHISPASHDDTNQSPLEQLLRSGAATSGLLFACR